MKKAKVHVSTRITDLAVLLVLGGGVVAVASPSSDIFPLSSGEEGSSFMFMRASLAFIRKRGRYFLLVIEVNVGPKRTQEKEPELGGHCRVRVRKMKMGRQISARFSYNDRVLMEKESD